MTLDASSPLNHDSFLDSTHSGNRMVTLSDVAKLAGVSRWVAGHVLNGGSGNSRCSEKRRRIVLDAAKQLKYRPNHAAQLLRGKRSKTFGVLVASAGDPLRPFLVQFLDTEAFKLGCQTVIGNTVENIRLAPNRFDEYVEDFYNRKVDGVFCLVHRWWPGDRRTLLESHPNTVFYNDPGIPSACYVTVDRSLAIEMAVNHLVTHGRKNIGLILANSSRNTQKARLDGYKKALAHHGIPVQVQNIFNASEINAFPYAYCDETDGMWHFPDGLAEIALDQLILHNKVDGIVAYDDFWAAVIIRSLRKRNIRVPQDVAVVGYLNHYLADWTDPPLTTLDLCHEKAAAMMIQMMNKMIRGETLTESERTAFITPRLIVRESA